MRKQKREGLTINGKKEIMVVRRGTPKIRTTNWIHQKHIEISRKRFNEK